MLMRVICCSRQQLFFSEKSHDVSFWEAATTLKYAYRPQSSSILDFQMHIRKYEHADFLDCGAHYNSLPMLTLIPARDSDDEDSKLYLIGSIAGMSYIPIVILPPLTSLLPSSACLLDCLQPNRRKLRLTLRAPRPDLGLLTRSYNLRESCG